jgi:hypothetical protein
MLCFSRVPRLCLNAHSFNGQGLCVTYVDVELNPQLAVRFGVRSFCTRGLSVTCKNTIGLVIIQRSVSDFRGKLTHQTWTRIPKECLKYESLEVLVYAAYYATQSAVWSVGEGSSCWHGHVEGCNIRSDSGLGD